MNRVQIISIIFSLLLLFVIFELVRKKKLKEQYSIIWFIVGFILLLFSVFNGLLELISKLFGIFYAPALLILIVIFLGSILVLHFSVIISKLSEQNIKLAQEIALIKNKIEGIKIEKIE